MQAMFWRNVAILDARRVFCFVLSVFAVIFSLLANVDHQFADMFGNKYSTVFSFLAALCIANVAAYYRRPRYMW